MLPEENILTFYLDNDGLWNKQTTQMIFFVRAGAGKKECNLSNALGRAYALLRDNWQL